MLNEGQQKALNRLVKWYSTTDKYIILSGRGGVGKSFLINEVCKTLKVNTLLTAPTHEALKQLRDKIDNPENELYAFKTIHSALGISAITSGTSLKFTQTKTPKIWDSIELCIIDECSMIDEWLLGLICSTGAKLLFVGHESQLPPVVERRKVSDKCISPVFNLSKVDVLTLTQPVRNEGELWEFTNVIENTITTLSKQIPETFDIKKKDLLTLLDSEESKQLFLQNKCKIVLWSNTGVDYLNSYIRNKLFGEQSKKSLYLPTDKIIFTSPLSVIENLDTINQKDLKQCEAEVVLYSNSKGEVLAAGKTVINLENKLIPCHKLKVDTEQGVIVVYACINPLDKAELGKILEHKAWSCKSIQAKKAAYNRKHFILSCFADIKHFYTATCHRLQGSTIERVIVINSDIAKNPNLIEQNKCRYVAVSRASKQLYFYRGLL